MRLPFSLNREIFRWGPVPGRFFYLSVFSEVNFKHFCHRFPGHNWSRTLFLFRQGRMFFVNEQQELLRAGEKVFLDYLLDHRKRSDLCLEWIGIVNEMEKIEDKITHCNLSDLATPGLLKLWNDFHCLYINFWTIGMVPELGNYGYGKFFEQKLRRLISSESELLSLMEVLTAPEKLSFYQQEEIDLYNCVDLDKHINKYFWLKNSYNGTQLLDKKFFADRKAELATNIEAIMRDRIEQVKNSKEQVRKKFGLPAEIMDIARTISDCIAWQDERKKHIFIALHFQEMMLKGVANRFDYELSDLFNAWYWEIANILSGSDLRLELKRRIDGFGILYYEDCRQFYGQEVTKLWQAYDYLPTKDSAVRELKGIVASKGKGKVRAKAMIVLDPNKIESFELGAVLVAPMTSPEYIFAMKKASAVVTDTGGLTSHAAIVSRELGIACLVGTGLATKLIKDGDLLEIDTIQGVVKIIK